jgi:membrane-bound lytic murein transglycosylase D
MDRVRAVITTKETENAEVLPEKGKNIGTRNDHSHRSRVAAYRTPSVKLNKKGVKFVKNYIRKSNSRLNRIRKRSTIPFEIIDSVFYQYGLPRELRYLAVVESELKPTATSRVGAKGPWQLMPETAQILGLKVDEEEDDRTDYYKSTPAAARYLKDLYAQFSDWLLVLAAYNGGPAPVYRAIHKSHSRNFWILQRCLPAETRVHVKRFIATHYYFEGHGSVTTLTRAERINYLKTVRRFENAHPGAVTSDAREQGSATWAGSRQSAKNMGVEAENEKFKRVMANAETAILNSSSARREHGQK